MAESKTNPRPLPEPSRTTQPFWDGARDGKLLLQYDKGAGKYQFWPRPTSIHSANGTLEWRPASGRGTLFAKTIVHVPARGFEDLVPYTLAAVDLEEGVRVVGRLVGIAPEDAKHGMKLRVCWDRLSDEINYFAFEADD